jgi:hypothetical protein
MNINVYIKPEEAYSSPIEYFFSILGKNKSLTILFLNSAENAEIIVDHTKAESIPIATDFYKDLLIEKKFGFNHFFKSECLVKTIDGKPDYQGTIFYMLNCFQEYGSGGETIDKLGRFKFTSSYQFKFDSIEKNLVQEYLDQFCMSVPILKKYADNNIKSKIFLSHDIDSIHGALLQDGFWALKKGRIDIVLRLMMNAILLRPDWKNMDQINKIHSEHDLKSTFFWIVNKGTGLQGVKNADYSIRKLKSVLEKTESNGLHKSSSSESIPEELLKLPVKTSLNRYHFLKYTLPDAFREIDEAGITFDASLGFAEHVGFRNSYGLPFCPYDLKTRKPHNFVEVPLNMMDRTYHQYMKVPLNETSQEVIKFVEKHKENCVLSLLWHNNYFTAYKYGGYLNEYKKVLNYFHESGIQCTTPNEIINQFR